MNNERKGMFVIVKILLSFIPLLLGMPTISLILCACNIAAAAIFFGSFSAVVASVSAVLFSMLGYGMLFPAGELQGLFVGIEAVACGISAAFVILNRKNFYEGVWLGSISYLAVNSLNMYQISSEEGVSIAQYLTNLPIELAREQFGALFKEAGVSLDILENIIAVLEKYFVMIIPSVLVLSSVFIGYAVMWGSCALLRRTPFAYEHSFARMRMPRVSVVIMVLSLVLWIISMGTDVEYVLVNILVIFAGLAFFSGLSLAEFFLRRAVKNPFLRIVIHIAVYTAFSAFMYISPYVNIFVIYIVAASADAFFNFRKLTDKSRGDVNEE